MKEKEFPVLETERLILREVKPEDATSIFHYLSDKEVMKYYGMSPMSDVSEAVEEIDWYRRIFDDGTGIRWGIVIKGTSEVIGSCGFLQYAKHHARVGSRRRACKGILEKRHHDGSIVGSRSLWVYKDGAHADPGID